MEGSAARILPLAAREARSQSESRHADGSGPSLRPIEGILIVIDDGALEALATVFAMSPVREATTFEAYLAMRGYARASERR